MTPGARRPPPPPGEPAPFRPPVVHRLERENGFTILLVEDHTVPLVRLSWVAKAGAQYDPAGLEGLASLTASLLKEAPDNGLGRRAETLGAGIVTGCDWDYAVSAFQHLPGDLDAALELIAELMAPPCFPEPALASWRRKRIAQAVQRRRQPAAVAADGFASAVYGDSRYGRPQLGSEASLLRVTRQDLIDFHRRHYGPGAAFLTAAGSFSSGALGRRLASALPAASCEEIPTPPVIEPPRPSSARVILWDVPGAVHTELRLGHAGVARRHPDFVRLKVLNTVLGGTFGSRLNLNLRERQGYTYFIKSSFAARQGPAPFVVASSVANRAVGAAICEIRNEIERLQQEKVPDEELEDARNFLIGSFPRRFQNVHELSLLLTELALDGVAADHLARFPQEIRQVDSEDLLDLARCYLHPDQAVIVAAGPAAEIRDQLASLGELTEKTAAMGRGRIRPRPLVPQQRFQEL